MIARINRISNFGIYRDFDGSDPSGVPPFKKRNLIYGWNYSGKTTLSRLFQSLQHSERPLPHPEGQFSIVLENGTTCRQNEAIADHPIRVFNRDYIDANFREEHRAPAVFIVGEENLQLVERYEELQKAQVRLQERIDQRTAEIRFIESNDDRAASQRASDVGGLLGVRNFRKPDLERIYPMVRTNPESSIIADEELQAKVDTYRTGDQFERIEFSGYGLPRLHEEIASVRDLLLRTASFDAIQSLRENPDVENWIRRGVALHESESGCLFCGSGLSAERLERLGRHFSTASEELLSEIERKIQSLEAFAFDLPRMDPVAFLQEHRDAVRSALTSLETWLSEASRFRDQLVASLHDKRMKLEREVPLALELLSDEGVSALNEISRLVEIHNNSVRDFSTAKERLRVEIQRHYAAVHYSEQQLAEHAATIEKTMQRVSNATKAKARLRRITDEIFARINRSARGAERFMELVSFLLRGNEIRVVTFQDTHFQLMRGEQTASRLSEGEKTAIALAYFVTSLEGEEEDLSNSIIYVDDPISSLDSNHVYAVYALIQERLEAASQIFVSTHNSEFFNLLKARWLKNRDQRFRNNSEGYYIRRRSNENGAFSEIEKLPELLRNFQSEYQFVFSQLYQFSREDTPDERSAYSSLNLVRKFLEAYLGFKKPHITAWHEKLDLLFDSEEERREMHKLVDDASHLQAMGRMLQEPTFVSLAHSRVQCLLEALRTKDPEHYSSLESITLSAS